MTSGELELGPPERLNDRVLVLVMSPHAHQGLSNTDAGHGAQGLAEGTSHPGLEPIGTGTRQHFVDPQHVERMDTDPDVELILGGVLDQVLKAGEGRKRILVNTCSSTFTILPKDKSDRKVSKKLECCVNNHEVLIL